MPTIVRIRELTDSQIQIILTRAPGEDNRASPDDLAIKGCETRVRRRNPVTHNEWTVTVLTSTVIASAAAAIVQGISQWASSRNGRRYKIKHGDREYEAPSLTEMKKLIKLAGDEIDIRILPPTEKLK